MNSWNSRDARSCFPEVMRRALAAEPQRMVDEGAGAVVVLSEAEYERLLGQKNGRAAATPANDDRPNLVEFMRNSPLAAAIRDGELPEDIFDQIREESRRAARYQAKAGAAGPLRPAP